ncbi:type II restriction endonuclease [Candidatus Woesearchaeota archaeon]|nr:type II restriction endonuclease [Candidatus Woesearchaeota archaeon]
MVDLVSVGSQTAKSGFENEKDIIAKFQNWKQDIDAKKWLKIMGYNISKIKKVNGVIIYGEKADIQIQITIKTKDKTSKENLSLKKSTADFNQIDKRWIKNYVDLWNIPSNIVTLLKMFTGELSPKELVAVKKITKEKYESLRDKRRIFLDEMDKDDRDTTLNFFKKNKNLIISDLIKGRGEYSADWVLVTQHNEDRILWVLRSIEDVINILSQEDVRISPQGSLYIGKITMQRKGGDGGRPTANMLQFKMKPNDLF